VIERWRSASMSHRSDDDVDYSSSFETPPLQPVQPTPVPPAPRGDALRSGLLKKPLETGTFRFR
jgi:hypothetical protein